MLKERGLKNIRIGIEGKNVPVSQYVAYGIGWNNGPAYVLNTQLPELPDNGHTCKLPFYPSLKDPSLSVCPYTSFSFYFFWWVHGAGLVGSRSGRAILPTVLGVHLSGTWKGPSESYSLETENLTLFCCIPLRNAWVY